MMIEEITEVEIEQLVQDIGRCIRKELRSFASEKKEDVLLYEINSSKKSDEERLRSYLDRTNHEPKSIEGGRPVFERSYVYLVKELRMLPSESKEVFEKLIAERRVQLRMINDEVTVVFHQPTKADSK